MVEDKAKDGIEEINYTDNSNISTFSISYNTAPNKPENSKGKRLDIKIIKAISGGMEIDVPNLNLINSLTGYYPTGSNSNSSDVYENLFSSIYVSSNMTWKNITDYMIVKISKPSNLYVCTLNSAYMRSYYSDKTAYLRNFNSKLKVERLVKGDYEQGSWIDITTGANQKTIVSENNGYSPSKFQLFIENLPSGVYKFSYKEGLRVDTYWYAEELENFDDGLKINKINKEDFKESYDLENCNRLDFISDGRLFTYTINGKAVQIGCSREEFENLRAKVSDSILKFNQLKW